MSIFIGGTGSANELDDYEEGQWTCTVNWNGGNTTGTAAHSTAVTGDYRKIGSIVYISLGLYPANYNSGNDCVIVNFSLPFSPSGTHGLVISAYGGWGNYGGWLGSGFNNYFARANHNSTGSVSVSQQTGGSGFWGHRYSYTPANGFISGCYMTS